MQKGLIIQGFQMCNVRLGSFCLSLLHSIESLVCILKPQGMLGAVLLQKRGLQLRLCTWNAILAWYTEGFFLPKIDFETKNEILNVTANANKDYRDCCPIGPFSLLLKLYCRSSLTLNNLKLQHPRMSQTVGECGAPWAGRLVWTCKYLTEHTSHHYTW